MVDMVSFVKQSTMRMDECDEIVPGFFLFLDCQGGCRIIESFVTYSLSFLSICVLPIYL